MTVCVDGEAVTIDRDPAKVFEGWSDPPLGGDLPPPTAAEHAGVVMLAYGERLLWVRNRGDRPVVLTGLPWQQPRESLVLDAGKPPLIYFSPAR